MPNAQTMAPAFAVRARRGAPVSCPIDWGELRQRDLRPDGATIRNVFDRLATTGDPWHDFLRHNVSLTETPEPPGRVRRAGPSGHLSGQSSAESTVVNVDKLLLYS
jgi:DNA primase